MNKLRTIPLINLNAYCTKLDGVDNRELTEIVLSSKEKPAGGEFMVDNNHTYFEDTVLPNVPAISSLIDKIEKNVTSVLQREYVIESIWGLILEKGQSVMMHTHKSNAHLHPSEYYSIAYYPSAPDGSADLIFSLGYCNVIDQAVRIQPEEGMLVVFNSYIPHMTSRHDSDKPRIVISANLAPRFPNTTVVPDWTPYTLINEEK